jgi:methylenetetrahydrofolate dehydrogenase (NADP+) / methenyltetrahydrofolate cyclohydrolase
MALIDGKKIAQEIKEEVAKEVAQRKVLGLKIPHLAAVLVGNDGASETYVGAKVKSCYEVGFESSLLRFEASISEEELLNEIEKLNNNPAIDGFIVQLPLPKHINEQKVIEAVNSAKDVDGFHPVNAGKMLLNLPSFLPATPYGIIQLLERYNIETSGKHCVVIGRSNIVGMPMGVLLARNTYPGNCTVTITHSRTKNLKELTLQADIIVAALGKAEFLTADMVKQGAVVIDVGITRLPSDKTKSGFKLYGDVKFDEVAPKCSYITPVPGGVGPMTIMSLIKNTLQACRNND